MAGLPSPQLLMILDLMLPLGSPMVGRYTNSAPGVLQEVRIAREEGIPIVQVIG